MHFWNCDPRKNVNCSKRSCYVNGNRCFVTSDFSCALDSNKPLHENESWRAPSAEQIRIAAEIKSNNS